MNQQAENVKDSDSSWWVFAVMAAVVGVVMWIAYYRLKWLIAAESWSTFADVYAATVGTLFAGLAFAGIIWTIMLQRRELALQRGELKRSANAQEASEKAFTAQVKVAQQSARLSAATALLDYRWRQITQISERLRSRTESPDFQVKMEQKVRELIDETERLEKEIESLRDELMALIHHVEIETSLPSITGSMTVHTDNP